MKAGLKALLISAVLVGGGGLAHADSAFEAPRPGPVSLTDTQMDAAVAGHLYAPAIPWKHYGEHWKAKYKKVLVYKGGKWQYIFKKTYYVAHGWHQGCGAKKCTWKFPVHPVKITAKK